MTKSAAIQQLKEAFSIFETAIETFPEEIFFTRPANGKWSAAENAEHLFLSVKPLVGLFGKTDIMLNNWGKSEKPSISYDELVNNYGTRLEQVRSVSFAPVTPGELGSREDIISNLKSIHNKFIERTEGLKEDELDAFQVPHPLLGMLNCREFVYFTAYHTLHHYKAVKSIHQ